MAKACTLKLLPLVQIVLLVACGTEPAQRVLAPSAEFAAESQSDDDGDGDSDEPDDESPRFSTWSVPVNLGPVVNTPFQDRSPVLSPDKLSLYFTSDRPGGFGGGDLYVSRRDCLECPFGPAVNVGPNINTAGNEGDPQVSSDGKLLLFSRPMPDGFEDILVSEREKVDDDFGWGPPKGLCSELNDQVSGHFNSQWLMKKPEKSGLSIYFGFRPTFAVPIRMYRASVDEYHDDASANFGTCGNMEPATELNQTVGATNDADATIRKDGKEMFFWSGRPDASGVADPRLWTATRARNDGPWSTPVPVGVPIDSPVAPEFFPSLSWDTRTLVFAAGRLRGGSGLNDIWITERTPLDEEDNERSSSRRH